MGTYIRLVDYGSQQEKENAFLEAVENKNISKIKFNPSSSDFPKIPGSPIAYWVSKNLIQVFEKGEKFYDEGNPRVGMQTSNNDKFLRLWFEVNKNEFFSKQNKWIKYIKGGAFRKWYGNLDYVLWYNGKPDFILQQKNARVLPESELNELKCTWTDLATSRFSSRVCPIDSFHDISGHCFYPTRNNKYFLLAYTNSCVFQSIIDLLNSSLHYQVGDVARTPVLYDEKQNVSNTSIDCVEISKTDWDSFETSWDFKKNPLL